MKKSATTKSAAAKSAAARPAAKKPAGFWKSNGLTLALFFLFGVSVVGHMFTAYAVDGEESREHGRAPASWGEYLKEGHFWESLFENWESEFLQMALYVLLTVFLFQKGSAESKDPEKKKESADEDPLSHRHDPRAPWPVRRGGWALAVYNHSLTIALLSFFAASFALHAVFGWRAQKLEAVRHGLPPDTFGEYARGAQFWFESLQNWQSEFLSVGVLVWISIYLRQIGSPESKQVHAPHDQTGKG